MAKASAGPDDVLYGVWQNVDTTASMSRFSFGMIVDGQCQAARAYEDVVDTGICLVDTAKHVFTFVITGAEDDKETYDYDRQDTKLVLRDESGVDFTFRLIANADVAAELAGKSR